MGILLHIYEQMICFHPLACLGCPYAKPLVDLVLFCRNFSKKIIEKFHGDKIEKHHFQTSEQS